MHARGAPCEFALPVSRVLISIVLGGPHAQSRLELCHVHILLNAIAPRRAAGAASLRYVNGGWRWPGVGGVQRLGGRGKYESRVTMCCTCCFSARP